MEIFQPSTTTVIFFVEFAALLICILPMARLEYGLETAVKTLSEAQKHNSALQELFDIDKSYVQGTCYSAGRGNESSTTVRFAISESQFKSGSLICGEMYSGEVPLHPAAFSCFVDMRSIGHQIPHVLLHSKHPHPFPHDKNFVSTAN